MHGGPSTTAVPAKAMLVRVVMLIIQLPRGDLAAAYLSVKVRCGVILQYLDAVPPSHLIKVVTWYVSCEG